MHLGTTRFVWAMQCDFLMEILLYSSSFIETLSFYLRHKGGICLYALKIIFVIRKKDTRASKTGTGSTLWNMRCDILTNKHNHKDKADSNSQKRRSGKWHG